MIFLIEQSVNGVVSFLFVLLLGITVVPLIYGYYSIGDPLVAITAVLIAMVFKTLKTDRKNSILLVILTSLYIISMVSLFPSQIVFGAFFINILAHYAGFIVGYMAPWLLLPKIRSLRKQKHL